MHVAYLSLGSNFGDRAANLHAALDRLNGPMCRVQEVSPIYESIHVGESTEPTPDYLNCAARIATDLEPLALLNYTQEVEQAGGRTRSYRWSPRTIDIDLLVFDNVTLEIDRLVLPHPRLCERAFVLVPLSDIAPDLKLPDGTAISDLSIGTIIKNQQIKAWSNPEPASV